MGVWTACSIGVEHAPKHHKPVRVLLADDHEYFRQTLAGLFEGADDLEVVAQCSDGDQVVAAADASRPDVALLDVSMPNVSGLDAARALASAHPGVAVVMLSSSAAPRTVALAAAAGARGYLVKGTDSPLDAVRCVAAGGTAWRVSVPEATTRRGC